MLSEILTSESFWFWTLVNVQSGLIIWFVEMANPVAAGITVGPLIVGIAFFPTQWDLVGLGDLHSMSLPAWLTQNVWILLAGIGCYLFIGVAWATFRWWLYVRQMRESYERTKAEYGWLQETSEARPTCCVRTPNTAPNLRFEKNTCSGLRPAKWPQPKAGVNSHTNSNLSGRTT